MSMNMGDTQTIGALSALASSFTWAFGLTVYSRLSRSKSAFSINATRAAIGLPLFILTHFWLCDWNFSLIAAQLFSVDATRIVWFGISTVASYALGDVVFLWSTRALGTPGALAIASSYPLWSALAGWLLKGEGLKPLRMSGLVLVVVGTVTVILAGYHHHRASQGARRGQNLPVLERYPVGVSLGFCASLFWALNTFAVAKGGEGVPSAVGNIYRMGLALLMCPLFGRVLNRKWTGFVPISELRKTGVVFGTEAYGGSTAFLYGLTHAPLAVASALSGLAPVISAPLAWVNGTEKFSLVKTIGIVAVVIGVVALVQNTY